jgi:restriction endonuclease S subunit
MHSKLNQLASISSGYTFRGSIENDQRGTIFVLQAKNISANKDVSDITELTMVSDKSIRNPYFLEHNDILLVSRGSGLRSFRSAVFKSQEKNVMPSSSVHVIRVKDINVLPKYVSLYLNSDVGQKELLQIVTGGSYIQSILVRNLNEFEIPIPPMHTQKSIIALNENLNQQELILKRKSELKKNIISATFTNLINQ